MATSENPALGQWANAPLVYVLAQVRFLESSQSTPENIRDSLIRRMGARFTGVNPLATLGFQFNLGGEQSPQVPAAMVPSITGFDLLSPDMDAILRIQRCNITLALNRYIDYPTFAEEWMQILQVLEETDVKYVSRMGMRYVDFIYPLEGREPEDYLCAPWHFRPAPEFPGAIAGMHMASHLVDAAYPDGRMRIQYARGFGTPGLSPELSGMLPPAVLARSKLASDQRASGVIDTDHWIEATKSADVNTLRANFDTIHSNLSTAFRGMVTPFALADWQGLPLDNVAIGD